MKNQVAEYVARCETCQRVKAEHQRPAGLLQPLEIPEWKWSDVTMDFVTDLPRTPKGNDSVWVVVDRLTKTAHFKPMKKTDSLHKLGTLYLREILRLHGTPVSIVSDRDPRFVSRFWKSLHQALGTTLNFSTSAHSRSDRQSERTMQILKDMLRAYSIDFEGN